ncbi:MAG: NAD(P)-dependent oxidoreductase, partial [Pseudomonadota bacterium]
ANEFLNRRVDIGDAVGACRLAVKRASEIRSGTFIISATTPFQKTDLEALRVDAPAVVTSYADYRAEYDRRGWRMTPSLDRVYDNALARRVLGWSPRHDFASVLGQLSRNEPPGGALAREVGRKGYHDRAFEDGPYPTDAQ